MKKILIVEDNKLIASVYQSKLRNEGFDIEVAADGETGLQFLSKSSPDLILLDLVLPKLSGADFLTKVRQDPQWAQLPVIVFTQTHSPDLLQAAWKAGATQVLSKATSTPKEIIETIKKAVNPPSSSVQP